MTFKFCKILSQRNFLNLADNKKYYFELSLLNSITS